MTSQVALLILFLAGSAGAAVDPALNAERQAVYKELVHWSLLARRDWQPDWQADWNASARQDAIPGYFAVGLAQLQAVASQQDLDRAGLEALKRSFTLWKARLCDYLYDHAAKAIAAPWNKAAYCETLHDGVAGLVERTIAWRGRRQAPEMTDKAARHLANLRQVLGSKTADFLFDRSRYLRDAVGTPVRPPAPARATAALPPRLSLPPAFRTDLQTAVPSNGSSPPMVPNPSSWMDLAGLGNFIRQLASQVTNKARQVADSIIRYGQQKYAALETALVWVESHFKPSATSWAGAMGLGQLMPGTAAGCTANPYDINENIRCSLAVLRGNLAHFRVTDADWSYINGLYADRAVRVRAGHMTRAVALAELLVKTPMNFKNAVAAYNAGCYAIDVYGHGRYDRLPGPGYAETRKFVPSVLGRYLDVFIHAA